MNRAQNIKNATNMILTNSTSGPSTVGRGAVHATGTDQPPRNSVAASAGERERGAELADEEEQEAEARVLDHVAGDELGLGDRHVERRLGELGLGRDHEQREARRTA